MAERGGGMHGRGAYVVGGMCGRGVHGRGCAWRGIRHAHPPPPVDRILDTRL